METIDFSRYEGHTPGPWETRTMRDARIVVRKLNESHYAGVSGNVVREPDAKLIADAPLLLAEVKRLQDENHLLHQCNARQCERIDGLKDQLGRLRAELSGRYEQGYDAGKTDANADTGTQALQRLADELTVKIDNYQKDHSQASMVYREMQARISAMQDTRECIKRALRKGGAK